MSPTSSRIFVFAVSSLTKMPNKIAVKRVKENQCAYIVELQIQCGYLWNNIIRQQSSHSQHNANFSPKRNCSYLTVFESQLVKKTGFRPSTMPCSPGRLSIEYGQNLVIKSTTERAQLTMPP